MAKTKITEPVDNIEPVNTGTASTEPANTESKLTESQADAEEKKVESTAQIPAEIAEQLDAEEAEFKKLRRDLPGVKGIQRGWHHHHLGC